MADIYSTPTAMIKAAPEVLKPATTFSAVEQVFAKFDADGSGSISTDELENVLTLLGLPHSKEDVMSLMKVMDKDGDGTVDLEEFEEYEATHGSKLVEAEVNKQLKDAFNKYDKDKNGVISAQELHDILMKLGENVSEKECQKMIGTVDENGDGNLDFDEFKKMVTN